MLEVSGRDVLEALPLSSRHILGSAHTASFGSAPLCADRDRADGRTFLARAAARPAAAERRVLSFAVHLKCRRSVFVFFFFPGCHSPSHRAAVEEQLHVRPHLYVS